MYTYCFIDSHSLVQLPQGMKGKLEVIQAENVAVIVESSLSLEELQKDDESILEAVLSHDRVLREIFAETTILPLRFATYFKTREALIHHLEENGQSYQEKLLLLVNKAEYKLIANPENLEQKSDVLDEVKPSLSSKGRDFFNMKKRRYQEQQEYQVNQQNQWDFLLEYLGKEYPICLGNPSGNTQQCYILASRESTQIHLELLPKWQEITPHWQLTLSLALPPYHFV